MVEMLDSPEVADLARTEDAIQNGSTGFGEDSVEPPTASHVQPSQKQGGLFNRGKSGKNKHKKRSILWWFVAGGSLSILSVPIILLLIIISSLEIPNLGQNITELEISRLSRQFTYAMGRTVREVVAYQAVSDKPAEGASLSLDQFITKEYGSERSLLTRIKGLALNKVVDNIGVSNDIQFLYKPGSQQLSSIKLGNTIVNVPEQQGFLRSLVPDFLDLPELKAKAQFAGNFTSALDNVLGARGSGAAGMLIRNEIGTTLRDKFEINLLTWSAGKLTQYAADTPQEAEAQVNQDVLQAETEPNGVPESSPPSIENDMAEAEHILEEGTAQLAEESGPANDQKILALAKSGQNVTNATRSSANQALSGNFAKNLLKVGDPLLTLSMTACIIFEGSTEDNGATTDMNLQHEARAYFNLAGAGSEEEAGGPSTVGGTGKDSATDVGLRNAIGAMQTKIVDPTKTNAYIMDNGGTVDTTATSLSAEANPLQAFTLLDAMFGSDSTAKSVNAIAQKICPIMTHPITAGILTAANIGAIIFSFGGDDVAAEGATAAAQKGITAKIGDFFGAIGEKLAQQGLGGTTKRVSAFLGKNLGVVGGTVALTDVAKLVVLVKSGNLYNGLEQGPDWVNSAQAGADFYYNEQARSQTFAPALTFADTAKNDQLDKQYAAATNSSRNFLDRYLALSNPDSLLTHVGTTLYSNYQQAATNTGSFIDNFLLSPAHAIASLAATFTGLAWADPSPATQHYGEVQFGWTQDEENLIDSNTSYLPLENEKILDQSGLRDQIAEKYSRCFGYDYNASGASWDPTADNSKLVNAINSDASIGTLLADGSIRRTANGDLATDQPYLCSPENLGTSNPLYGDMVFRFRISESYYTTLAQLENFQTVTPN